MKSSLVVLSVLLFSVFSFAQSPSPSASASPAKMVAAPAATPAQILPAGDVAVAEPAAPPQWAENLLVSVQKLPVIGPIITKIMVWLGIVSAILTSLIAFLLTALSALSGVLNIAGLAQAADKIQLFKNGKIMYWLKYLSMFNAKKPEQSGLS